MSDEAALLSAIIAHPAEDTPRLAYADWLDENDAPMQAEFIRTQCRLASCSAADADYPDVLERHAELVAQFGPLAKMTVPELPPRFAFDPNLAPDTGHFRRGFLHTVCGAWTDAHLDTGDIAEGELEEFCAGLPRLIATTTARCLSLPEATAAQLARVLAAPGAEALTDLTVQPKLWTGGNVSEAVLRAVAAAPAVPNLERLALYVPATTADLLPLARAKLDRLAHFEPPMLRGSVRDLRALTAAPWFRGLRSVRIAASEQPLEVALLAALARLPHLESLDVRCQHLAALKTSASARDFPALAGLAFWLHAGPASAEWLAKGSLPRLAELELWGARTSHLAAILKARWLSQLRVLTLRGVLSDKVVVSLSKSAAAANLRILRFNDVHLGKSAFAALGDGARFPNLTTLDVNAYYGRKMTEADTAAFAKALSLPRLRHLDLSGWPLGDAGAKALAANPSLANLTRLAVRGCGIGEAGFGALVRSRHLQQLIELNARNNKLKTAAALRNTKWLPRLAAARLAGNAITLAMHKRLHDARGLVV